MGVCVCAAGAWHSECPRAGLDCVGEARVRTKCSLGLARGVFALRSAEPVGVCGLWPCRVGRGDWRGRAGAAVPPPEVCYTYSNTREPLTSGHSFMESDARSAIKVYGVEVACTVYTVEVACTTDHGLQVSNHSGSSHAPCILALKITSTPVHVHVRLKSASNARRTAACQLAFAM